MRLSGGSGDEKALIVLVGGEEAVAERHIDLVIGLRDARADHRAIDRARAERSIAAIVASVTPPSAPRQPAWAAPTTPPRIGEQHRRAIGGEDAEQQPAGR